MGRYAIKCRSLRLPASPPILWGNPSRGRRLAGGDVGAPAGRSWMWAAETSSEVTSRLFACTRTIPDHAMSIHPPPTIMITLGTGLSVVICPCVRGARARQRQLFCGSCKQSTTRPRAGPCVPASSLFILPGQACVDNVDDVFEEQGVSRAGRGSHQERGRVWFVH